MSVVLAEVSIRDIHPAAVVPPPGERFQHATVLIRFINAQGSPVPQTFGANAELLEICERLRQHGSVVVALDEQWQLAQTRGENLTNYVLRAAFKRLEELKPEDTARISQAGYDENLARSILELLNRIYPEAMPAVPDLKYALDNVPSDRSLLAALDALLGDGWIKGRAIRNDMMARARLTELLHFQITREGRNHLAPASAAAAPHSSVIVHGDQITNHGTVGAIGRHANGNVINNGSLSRDEMLAALDSLLAALEPFQQEGTTQRAHRDLLKVRDEILEEPEPDQHRMARWLKNAKQLLDVAVVGESVIEKAHSFFALFNS